jgi:two-component system response regulator
MTVEKAVNLPPVLLVEDDEEDVYIARRAFEEGRIANELQVANSGEEALQLLRRQGPYADPAAAPLPGVVLLDLNLPGMKGHEVLEQIKADPELHSIPVVVLTTSSEEADVRGCYERGANTYIVKPVAFESFLEAVRTLGRYWLAVAELPPPGRREKP